MGIKKKIVLGFILIGILLLMSGVLTSVELSKLNSDISTKIKEHEETFYLSRQLMEAVHQNNMAVLSIVTDSLDVYDSVLNMSVSNCDKILLQLKNREMSRPYVNRIVASYSRYQDVILNRDAKPTFDWFIDVYSHAYARLIFGIKDFLVFEQEDLLNYTNILEYNMYRSLMIGVISFLSAVFLLIAFYFMIRQFFLSPILKIEKALRDFLKANITYSVKIETTDEIHTLSSEIADLCSKSKKASE